MFGVKSNRTESKVLVLGLNIPKIQYFYRFFKSKYVKGQLSWKWFVCQIARGFGPIFK